jgi:leader peptidase (prepilin peptidase)/N-methyltransferase
MPETVQFLQTHPAAYYVVVATLGLCFGSFMNVVVYRLPIMIERQWQAYCEDLFGRDGDLTGKPAARFDLAKPDSHCTQCNHQIRWYENIPVVSYVFLRGCCNHCGAKISMRYPVIETATAILFVMVAIEYGVTIKAIAGMVLGFYLLAMSMIDYDKQLLPDALTLPLLWLGLLLSIWEVNVDMQSSIIGAAAGYLSLWSIYHVFRLVTGKEGMGYGDFKLLAVLGAWVGWQLLPVIILLSSFAGAVIGLSLMVLRNRHKDHPIPFGPYLAIAGWLAFMWGEEILNSYLKITNLV